MAQKKQAVLDTNKKNATDTVKTVNTPPNNLIKKNKGSNPSIEITSTATHEDVQEILGNSLFWYDKKIAKTDEEVEARLHEFFQRMYDTGELPTVEKMCLALGTTRKTVWEWENGSQGSERANVIKRAKEILAAMDAELVSKNKIPQVTYIFRSKNFFGMKDQAELQLSANSPLGDDVSEEQILAHYQDSIPSLPIKE